MSRESREETEQRGDRAESRERRETQEKRDAGEERKLTGHEESRGNPVSDRESRGTRGGGRRIEGGTNSLCRVGQP